MRVITIIPSVALKTLKIILNTVIWYLYWKICKGEFLGENNANTVTFVSGTLLIFIIYNVIITISYIFGIRHQKMLLVDIIINIFGGLLFIVAGILNIRYRIMYELENEFDDMNASKFVGVVVGMLSIFTGVIYLMDGIVSWIFMYSQLHYGVYEY